MDIIRVLIVDDHPMVRRGLRNLLATQSDIVVVGEAGDAATALQAAVELSPEIILLDIRLPGPDGIEAAYHLRHKLPKAKLIALSAYYNEEYVLGALRAGVAAYLLKNASDDMVVEAIRRVHKGEYLVSPSLMSVVLRRFQDLARAYARANSGLSEWEIEILSLMARGATNREISQTMYWSERTVKRKVRELMDKLGARNRTQVVAEAIKRGLI